LSQPNAPNEISPPSESGASSESRPTVVAVPVSENGWVGSWGRARKIAIATVQHGTVAGWEECEVGWDVLHDTGSEPAHHARVARFVEQHGVQAVVAHHMGRDMQAMLERMHLNVHLGTSGDARQAALLGDLAAPV
jgi:predicted Fe-Mo cluster-binding NifX family protein